MIIVWFGGGEVVFTHLKMFNPHMDCEVLLLCLKDRKLREFM